MYLAFLSYLISLWGWSFFSLKETRGEITIPFFITFAVIAILGMFVCLYWRKRKAEKNGIMIALILLALNASVAFRMGSAAMRGFSNDLFIMVCVFVIIYLFIKHTNLYKIPILNMLIGVMLPISLVGARLSGNLRGGSYIYFCGFLIFGLVLMGYPFVTAFLLDLPETYYWGGSVKNLSWNVLGVLFYTLLLFFGCALCNEFGLLLVLGITATGVFFVRCKNWITKLLYSGACLAGVLVTCRFIPHVRDRVLIWLNPSEAAKQGLAVKAETVLYLFRNFNRMGWYGNGISNLSEKIYRTLHSDHVLVTMMNDYSMFIALFVIVLGLLLICWMFRDISGIDGYDRYLLLSSALIISSVVVIHVGSNLGSFLTAGIGFPFLSDGGSVNVMLTVLVAVRCGISERMVSEHVTY